MLNTNKKKIGIFGVVRYFRKINMQEKRRFFTTIFGGILASIGALFLPIYYSKIIDTINLFTTGNKAEGVTALTSIILIILLIEIVHIGGWRTYGFSIIPLEAKSMKKIYMQCFEYLHGHSYRFFTNSFSGSLVKKVNKLVGSYENITDIFLYDILRLIIFLPFIIITVSLKDRLLGVIFMSFIVIYGIIQYVLYKWNMPNEIASNEQDSKITGELSDTITNSFNILTFASLRREIQKFFTTLSSWEKIQKKTWLRGEWTRLIGDFLLIIFEIVSIYVSIVLRGKGIVSAGTIVLIQAYIFKVFDQMTSIGHVFKRLNRSIGESTEMLEILDTPHEIKNHSTKQLIVHDGKIECENLSFEYIGGKPIFKDLNLRIKPGEKVAIVGKSGSGKTSLIKLLFRFFDIQGGKIFIDGQDIAHVAQDSLRGNMSMVPQDPVLFHRSIKENIAYGNPEASDEEIIAASKMARCHGFIKHLKEGYDTLVGERGIKLSGGERQRVAIARAILENKRILVLDEATSSLDSESEQLIQEAMDEVMRNKTVIVIAHRLSTIMKMDKIIVMSKGQIIEKGSHKELLAQDKGTYKKLRDIQSGGFIE